MTRAGGSKQACANFLLVALICAVPLPCLATPLNIENKIGEPLEKGVNIVLGKSSPSLHSPLQEHGADKQLQAPAIALRESATDVIPLREEADFYAAVESSTATDLRQRNATVAAVSDVVEDRMLLLKLLAVLLIASMSLVGVLPPILGWDTLMGG
eukprot:2274848-Rhodomonas_salina.2